MSPELLNLLEYLTLISPFLLFVGMVIGVAFYSKLEDSHRLLVIYLFVAFLIDILSRLMGIYYNNNLILIPLFGLFELLLLSRLYFKHLIPVKSGVWSILIAFLVVFNLVEIVLLFDVTPEDFSGYSRALDSLAIVILSIVFYLKQIANDQELKPGFFFLNTLIFVFHSLNLILYLPLNFLINENSNVKFHFWSISLVLTLIFYISIIRILWTYGKNPKP